MGLSEFTLYSHGLETGRCPQGHIVGGIEGASLGCIFCKYGWTTEKSGGVTTYTSKNYECDKK